MANSSSFRVNVARPLASGCYRPDEWTLDTVEDFVRGAPLLEKDPHVVPGVFVGTLGNRRATAANVLSHTALVLDLDTAVPSDVPDRVATLGWDAVTYTTASHTDDAPRLRVIALISRPVTPAEYKRLFRWASTALGVELDPSAAAGAHRFFLPHIAPGSDLELLGAQLWRSRGKPIDVDPIVADQGSQRPGLVSAAPARRRDPLALPGVAGAFNRAYTLGGAVEAFGLPYRPLGHGFIHIDSTQNQPGLTPVNEDRTLWFDHAGSSPTHGQTMSVFDIVAEWKYGLQTEGSSDNPEQPPAERASRALFGADAAQMPLVVAELASSAFPEEAQTPEGEEPSVSARLASVETCEAALSPRNAKTGRRNLNDAADRKALVELDPLLSSRATSVMGRRPGWRVRPPWASQSELFEQERARLGLYPDTDEDEAAVQQYLGATYCGDVPAMAAVREILSLAASLPGREVDPLTGYLDGLRWDGVKRLSGGPNALDEVLPGVPWDDKPEREWSSRAVMRACVAAVARAFEPGYQVDSSLVLVGPQGTRKTSWVRWLAGPWSAALPDILGGDADLFDPCHKAWIVEADEGFAVTRSGSRYGDALKRFLTARSDTWRPKYGRTSRTMARRFVVWGTTNHEDFLANEEGNRRYWPVKITRTIPTELLTGYRRDQIWAEAVHLYRNGEKTWMSEAEEQRMQAERASRATEEDPLLGPVARYLAMPKPEGFAWMGKQERETAMLAPDPTWTPQPVSAPAMLVDLRDEIPARTSVRAITRALREVGSEPLGQKWGPGRRGGRVAVWSPVLTGE